MALALKDERPDLLVTATDIDPDALTLARENGFHQGLGVEFVQADLLAGLSGRFDAVLANLPYVAAGAVLPLDVVRYEPAGALFGGSDGLDVIRRLLAMGPDVDLIALEVGAGQARTVAALLTQSRTNSIEILHDLAGHERVVVGRR